LTERGADARVVAVPLRLRMSRLPREEWRAWREARRARLQELRAHIARIEAELAAKQKPA
jgi:hypothetical protein